MTRALLFACLLLLSGCEIVESLQDFCVDIGKGCPAAEPRDE